MLISFCCFIFFIYNFIELSIIDSKKQIIVIESGNYKTNLALWTNNEVVWITFGPNLTNLAIREVLKKAKNEFLFTIYALRGQLLNINFNQNKPCVVLCPDAMRIWLLDGPNDIPIDQPS